MTATKEEFLEALNTPLEALNQNELDLVQGGWDAIHDKQLLGMTIMERIFLGHSEIKHLWNFADNLMTSEDIQGSEKVRLHAKKIMLHFGKLIKAASTGTNFDELGLDKVGAIHVKYNVEPEYFRHFEESLFFAIKSIIPDVSAEMVRAWKKFVLHLVARMADGIKKEKSNEKSN